MYYQLRPEIYLVEGALYSCIYDLPGNKLHKISKKASEVLSKALRGDQITDSAETKFIDTLYERGLIIKTQGNECMNSIEIDYSYDRALDFAWIELTNKCNLRCIHCYNEQEQCGKTILSLEDFKRVVDQLCSVGIDKIQLIGGEPFLLSKDTLFAMMDYLSPRVKGFELFTNGTIATENDWKEIKERYENVSVAASLHSYKKEEHERVTQVKDSFNKTEQTLKTLKALDIPYRFVGTLIGGLEIGEDNGIGTPSRRDYVRLAGRANLALYDDNLLRRRMITEKEMHSGNLKQRIKSIYEENCFSTHLYIGCDMNVYPCPMERRLCHGNLKRTDLKDLLKPEILNHSKKTVEGCKDCEYRFICRDCRPDSITGDLAEKPWYCTYNPYSGQWETFEEFKNRIYNI